ncbi:pitrilysin family protein [Devosia sp.]|uniref:M16 family metallopeptidase n=1 Tax=Devosia sp. TaxID=1871048 RepID=UPI003262D380
MIARLIRPLLPLWIAAISAIAVLPAAADVTFQDVTSPKGIHAWLVEDYSVPLITIRFAFNGGSTQDPAGKEGLANLITALFDEGAGDLDSDAFQIRLDAAGAEMGFSASVDGISGGMRMLADQRDEAVSLLTMAIQSPRFDQNPIDRMRAQIVAGIQAGERDPQTKAQEAWSKAIYGTHPYGRKFEGTAQTLAGVTAADLRAFYKANFARDNLTIGVVGAIDAATLKTVLDQIFSGLPDKASISSTPDLNVAYGRDLHVEYALPQTSIYMAYPALKRDDPQFFAAYLMNEILGGSDVGSRLFTEVRDKRGLAYGATSSIANLDHADMLIVGTSTRADRATETLQVMQDVIAGLAKDGPMPQELAATKTYAIGSYAINNLGNSGAIASVLVSLQQKHLGIDYLQRRPALIDAVTIDDVKAVAKQLLGVKPTILTVGPAAPPKP